MKALLSAAGLAAGLALAFLAGRCSSPPGPVTYERVIVPESVLVRSAPDTIVQWRERVVYRTVQAEPRAEAPGAAETDVARFCALARDTVRITDTVHVAAAAPPRLALAYAGRFDGRRLSLWEITSDGARVREDFRVRVPHQWAIRGDSALVQSSRWWWVRPLLACLPPAGAGWLLEGRLGAAAVGGACIGGRVLF